MLTLERMQSIRLARRPLGQVVFANTILLADFRLPRPTRIVLEGVDNVPRDRAVIFAMNHTDRYNYWPFQYQMYRRGLPFTATWVKGKYYEHPAMAAFMDACNNIPLPSRGFVIGVEFRSRMGRKPTGEEYRALRDRVDGKTAVATPGETAAFLRAFCGDASDEAFRDAFDALWLRYVHEILRLTRKALDEVGNNLLVFPEGTRSVRLGKGQVGLMQMAWHLGHDIVPVGCNGSDLCYPRNSPFSKGGEIVYRIGAPLRLTGPELAPFAVPSDVIPLTKAADAHASAYRGGIDVVMRAIAGLLDERHLPSADGQAGKDAVERFL